MSTSAATRVLGIVLTGLLLLSTLATAAVSPRLSSMSANASRFGVRQAATANGGSTDQVAKQTASDPIRTARIIPSNADGTLDYSFDSSNMDTVQMNIGELIGITLVCFLDNKNCANAQNVKFEFTDETYLMQSTHFDGHQGGYVPGYALNGDAAINFGMWRPVSNYAAAVGDCSCSGYAWPGSDVAPVIAHGNKWNDMSGKLGIPPGVPAIAGNQYSWQAAGGASLHIIYDGNDSNLYNYLDAPGSQTANFGILQIATTSQRYLHYSLDAGEQTQIITGYTTNKFDDTIDEGEPIGQQESLFSGGAGASIIIVDPIGFQVFNCWYLTDPNYGCNSPQPTPYLISHYDHFDSLSAYLMVQSSGSATSLATFWVPIAKLNWNISATLTWSDGAYQITSKTDTWEMPTTPDIPSYDGAVTDQEQVIVANDKCYCAPQNQNQ